MQTLPITDDTHVLVLTGAGVSAESGVPTFRDADGLWEGHDVQQVATPSAFLRDPLLVWRFYSERRANMDGVEPNDGHRALAALERRLGNRFLLVTQNVDGLHAAAGSERMIELHGNLMTSRCTVCDRAPFADRTAYKPGVAPMCGRCKAAGKDALLRPHIVWFGELIDRRYLERIEGFVSAAGARLVFLAIGTSGLVHPAAGLVDAARAAGGSSWLVNAERPANAAHFDHVVIGASGKILPTLLAA
ncbi:MAG TPA: NAD-dependent deacylase [Kofleriaceae bacterium]|nr:NAD-dependent deacylase [Kofleriaceae bacterium]